MSDYGIASNETDTVSIEEEITQLGLKYSLVTEFTAFVAVDSNAVAGPSTGSSGEEDDGGVLTDTEEFSPPPASKKEFIKILGSIVDSEGLLRLKLENLNAVEYENLTIQITNANGQLLTNYRLKPGEVKNIISIPLNSLSGGIYFVTLSSNNQVLDTEKVLVKA